VGMSPWQANRLIPLMQSYSSHYLKRTLGDLLRAESRAKSTSIGAGLAYDLAILAWAEGASP
jgi:DNA polymerase III delta subunit